MERLQKIIWTGEKEADMDAALILQTVLDSYEIAVTENRLTVRTSFTKTE